LLAVHALTAEERQRIAQETLLTRMQAGEHLGITFRSLIAGTSARVLLMQVLPAATAAGRTTTAALPTSSASETRQRRRIVVDSQQLRSSVDRRRDGCQDCSLKQELHENGREMRREWVEHWE
jgi:hypothetical protein